MRMRTVLSLANAFSTATLLIILSIMTQTPGMRVTPEMVVEATKNTSPETGLNLLSRGIKETQHRAMILQWCCWGSFAMLLINTICWASFRAKPQPTNQLLEQTGPTV